MSDATLEETGPIDFLIVEFPAGAQPDGSALNHLIDLVRRGIIRVYDLAFVRKEADGAIVTLGAGDMGFRSDIDVSLLSEASSGLLDDGDLAEAAAAIHPGCTAGILVYENAWAAPFATALRATGAQLVAGGRIPIPAIVAALDALDANH